MQPFGADRKSLMDFESGCIVPCDIVRTLLNELEDEGIIHQGRKICLIRPNLQSFIQQIQDPRIQNMVRSRLKGVPLIEIGDTAGISRERVRQLTYSCLMRRAQILEEDKYIPVFEKYGFSKEEFILAYGEPEETFHYLNIICKKRPKHKKVCLKELVNDTDLAPELRCDISKLNQENRLCMNDESIEKSRLGLAEYVVRTYFKDGGTYDDFAEKYREQLRKLGLEQDRCLYLYPRFEKHLYGTDFLLWSTGRSLRYYGIKGIDFTAFLQTLNLGQYQNVEYSARKFYLSHPKLMLDYDIRDEYELHNLLRKICTRYGLKDINFLRMPMIEFGKADRYQQVYDLLLAHSPILQKDLISLYESIYGVNPESIVTSYLPQFSVYCHCGTYEIPAVTLSDRDVTILKKALKQDFYELKKVKCIFRKLFPDGDPDLVNPLSMRKAGFHVFKDHILSEKYPYMKDYIQHLLTSGEIVDLNVLPGSLVKRQDFQVTLRNLQANYSLIEVEPKKYFTSIGMRKYGLNKEKIQKTRTVLLGVIPDDRFFSVKQVRSQHPELFPVTDLPDGFYASILMQDKEQIRWIRYGGTRVLYKGKGSVSVNAFLLQLIQEHGPMELGKLHQMLERYYGVQKERGQLLSKVRSCDMYFHILSRVVYPNYDAFAKSSSHTRKKLQEAPECLPMTKA